MFSYLHGIRPGNRRSANHPAAAPSQDTSSRYYHEIVTHPPPSNVDSQPPSRAAPTSSPNQASPVSPDPPVLPPIPRVASQHERHTSDAEKTEHRGQGSERFAAPGRTPQESPPHLSRSIPKSNDKPVDDVRTSPCTTFQEMGLASDLYSNKPRPASSRRKRPIDVVYQSMRSHSEPPIQQNGPKFPQPTREPPPPPPKIIHPQRQAPGPPTRAASQVSVIPNPKPQTKTKLNLLNPMSLLARRRSSQAVEEAYSQSSSNPRLPDDFDPRIRGKVVHDFSAPRPDRPVSSNGNEGLAEAERKMLSSNRRSATKAEEESPSSTEREHTPIFKENFDDNVESWSSDMDSPAKRRSSAFMYQVSLQASQPPAPSALPAFARHLPTNLSTELDTLRKASTPSPKPQLEVLLETPAPYQKSAKSTPPKSPPTTRSRSTSNTESPNPPQRFKSNASRFSFDLAGVGSAAQEKLLEEKHRQKAKQKERESLPSNDDDVDYEDDYADYDDIDDGLEERIPGVNADAEDSHVPVSQNAIENLQFISPNKSSFESMTSPVSTGLTSPGTPRDSQKQSVGFTSKSSLNLFQAQPENYSGLSKEETQRPRSSPDIATNPSLMAQPVHRVVASESNLAGLPRRYNLQDDDDMYFDDGVIEDFEGEEPQTFDESLFDDDTNRLYGLPIRDLKPIPGRFEPAQAHDGQINLAQSRMDDSVDKPLARAPPESSIDKTSVVVREDSSTKPNFTGEGLQISHAAGLTQDNLGLHDRLAFAANQAALEGKFNRTHSQGSTRESYDGPNSSLGTTTQDNHLNPYINGLQLSRGIDDTDDFAFDDAHMTFTEAEDDDPIIAAANAEALENDDDGFYGQEFGFFARKPGSSESEYVNGGYFGARALESIHRMNSGRDHFLEPSLTPITERSEWSNRNSMVSLALHGYPLSAQYQSNPQLADLMRVQEGEELSLEALRKLRRGAWGGSNGSLRSSNNSQNGGSPLTYLPPNMVAPLMQQTNSNGSLVSPVSQNLAGSFHSFSSGGQISSTDSNSSPAAESPTVTLSMPQSGFTTQPQSMGPPPLPPKDPSPVYRNTTNQKPWVPGHSRTSSGAESVSYREENGKWFVERTRVIEETGEVEVLDRSVIEGGRI